METRSVFLLGEDYLTLLSSQQWQNPALVLTDFFRIYLLPQAQAQLWQLLMLSVGQPALLSQQERLTLFRFVNHLERLVEATWLLNNQAEAFLPNLTAATFDQDALLPRFSFLSAVDIRNPLASFRKLFRLSNPDPLWKPALLKQNRENLFDPYHFLLACSGTLREYSEFVQMNRALELSFLLTCHGHQLSGSHWSFVSLPVSPLDFGAQFYHSQGLIRALKALTFVIHFSRWHMEWHPAAAGILFSNYLLLTRLLVLAHFTSESTPAHDSDEIVMLRLALAKQFRQQSLTSLTRLLTRCLLSAASSGRAAWPSKKGTRIISEILHLSQAYFYHLNNNADHGKI